MLPVFIALHVYPVCVRILQPFAESSADCTMDCGRPAQSVSGMRCGPPSLTRKLRAMRAFSSRMKAKECECDGYLNSTISQSVFKSLPMQLLLTLVYSGAVESSIAEMLP